MAGVEQIQPVWRYLPLCRHGSCAEEVGHQPRLRCRIEEVEQGSGVVAVWVRQPDPAHVGRVDDRAEGVQEAPAWQTGVNNDGFGGVQDEGVHRHEPDARGWELVAEDADVVS